MQVETLNQKLMTALPVEIEACEQMYRQLFRSKPFPLSELMLDEDELESIYFDYAEALFLKETKKIKPCTFSCEHEFEHWGNLVSEYLELNRSKIYQAVSPTTLMCFLCNYKGEGEGELPVLYTTVQSLPLFISKQESFEQVISKNN